MGLVRKQIYIEAKIGGIVLAPNSIFRDDISLYICYIKGDLLYISDEKNTTIEDCQCEFSEDCYLV